MRWILGLVVAALASMAAGAEWIDDVPPCPELGASVLVRLENGEAYRIPTALRLGMWDLGSATGEGVPSAGCPGNPHRVDVIRISVPPDFVLSAKPEPLAWRVDVRIGGGDYARLQRRSLFFFHIRARRSGSCQWLENIKTCEENRYFRSYLAIEPLVPGGTRLVGRCSFIHFRNCNFAAQLKDSRAIFILFAGQNLAETRILPFAEDLVLFLDSLRAPEEDGPE